MDINFWKNNMAGFRKKKVSFYLYLDTSLEKKREISLGFV